jgi:hypothetical protein
MLRAAGVAADAAPPGHAARELLNRVLLPTREGQPR